MKLKNIVYTLSTTVFLAACSGGSSSSGSNNSNASGDASKIQFINPNTLASLPNQTNYGYAVVINPEPTAVTGIKYSISSPVGSGASITIDSASSSSCSIVAANSSCTLKLVIPAGAIAGSFTLSADNQVNGSAALQNSVPVGVTQIEYPSSGTNVINTYFYPKVIEGTEYVLVTGVVSSPSVTPFNMVTLIDSNGNELPNQEIVSGNLGAGLTNLSQGATFALLLPTSDAGSNQTIQLKLSEISANGTISNQIVNPATYNLGVEANQALINALPTFVNLTTTNPTQTVTLYNSGNATAQLKSLIANNPNLKVTFNAGNLASGATTTATVSLMDTSGTSTSSGLVLNWNNGVINTTDAIVVDQTITPTKKPGLKVTISPNTLAANTATGTVTGAITFTNIGNTPEQISSLSFSANSFSIAQADTTNIVACSVSNGKITTTLGTSSSNNSCTVKLHIFRTR